MDPIQLAVDLYHQQSVLLHAHLSDFAEADMVLRPAPAANHAAWQLGHLSCALVALIHAVTPGAMPALPEDFVRRHGPDGARLDEGFDPRDELLECFDATNEAAIQWVRGLSEAEKSTPTPEKLRGLAATTGHLVYALPLHAAMHVGQLQVIRRALGKPVLF
jgi:hypothetical protein